MADAIDRVKGKIVYAEDVLDAFYVASAGQDKMFIDIVEMVVEDVPDADVEEVKHGENIGTLHPVDEFICSECGIVLEGWTRVVTDEDDGELYYYEYEFNHCPNCGAKMDGGNAE